jgi:hypothetical protein
MDSDHRRSSLISVTLMTVAPRQEPSFLPRRHAPWSQTHLTKWQGKRSLTRPRFASRSVGGGRAYFRNRIAYAPAPPLVERLATPRDSSNLRLRQRRRQQPPVTVRKVSGADLNPAERWSAHPNGPLSALTKCPVEHLSPTGRDLIRPIRVETRAASDCGKRMIQFLPPHGRSGWGPTRGTLPRFRKARGRPTWRCRPNRSEHQGRRRDEGPRWCSG